jgi:DNA-binding response OmpR family regulator
LPKVFVKILICDDEPMVRTMLRRMLESAGHLCVEADNGRIAWDMIRASTPDIVISDWDMPELDGLGLCERVRYQPHRDQYVYFVLLTAKDRQHNLIQAMRHGADDYLVKPCDKAALDEALKKASRAVALHRQIAAQRQQLAQSTRKRMDGE